MSACVCVLMLTIQIAAEADTRLGYNIYPAVTETRNLFQMVATNRQKNEKKKTRTENKQEKSRRQKERDNSCVSHNKKWRMIELARICP